jgi:PAS domain S-box-containing protein
MIEAAAKTAARILIVEDERITAEDLSDILTGLGYTVAGVESKAEAALETARRTRPDLVLMDIHIQGDVDGVEAACELRESFDIPVIFLTAHSDKETLERAKKAEPLGYIVKPFQEPELRASIEMALYKHSRDIARKQKDQRLRTALDAVEEGVISLDREGRVTYMNAAAEAATGWSAKEAAGAGVHEVFRIFEGANHMPGGRLVVQALRGGVLSELSGGCTLMARDGAEIAVSGTVSPVRDHTGAPNGAVILFSISDASAREQPSPPAPEAAMRFASQAPLGFQLIAESPSMKQILKFAQRVARSEVSTILLEGESGTGKDMVAKFIHQASRRREGEYLAINCAAIPETLLESELFGYEKGAFTDARSQKKGILELATGGTVFLDEIGEMPLALQAKLLRVLEEQSFRRLGATRDIVVDLRVLTATNRELKGAIEQGRFRLDLFYRLNVIQIMIPPLRERREDILPLAQHFIRSYNSKFRRDIKGLSPEAAALLIGHSWPGNVRELRNMIERAMVLEEGSWLEPASLGIRSAGSGQSQAASVSAGAPPLRTGGPQGGSLEDMEKSMLLQALERSGWNQTRAARILDISRDTLRYRMKKFHLTAPAGAEEG